jgi:CheY-like chemotaxis protein
VNAARQRPFDLILMDLQMPGMDGYTAARAIRGQALFNSCTPIVALSANVLPEHAPASAAAGMNGHIGKPINVAELLSVVAAWAELGPDEDAVGASLPKVARG